MLRWIQLAKCHPFLLHTAYSIMIAMLLLVSPNQAHAQNPDLPQLLELAEQGDVEARYRVGEIYLYGLHIPADGKEALKHFHIAAEQNSADAEFALYSMYEVGWEIPANIPQSIYHLNRAAEILGIPTKDVESFIILTGIALSNMPMAQLALADGMGEGQDENQEFNEISIDYYIKSADQGNPIAQGKLGRNYLFGHGVPKDRSQAIFWITASAEQGSINSQNMLGHILYKDGNYIESKKWIEKAARRGHDQAEQLFGVMHSAGNGVDKDYTEGIKWFERSAEKGNSKAQQSLGGMYFSGQGVPKNYITAYAWLNIAAVNEDGSRKLVEHLEENYMNSSQIQEAQALSREIYQRIQQNLDD